MRQKVIDKLNAITASIPEHLKNNVMKMEYKSPVTREIAIRAMEDAEVDAELKSKLTNLYNAGMLDEQEEVINEEVTAQIDEYVESEILKAIEKKELPKVHFKKLLQEAKRKLKHGK